MAYLIDSDVLIDISRGKPAAQEYVDSLPDAWAISQISAMELIVGARDKREVADLDVFLSAYPIVPVQPSTGARAFGLLRAYAKSHGLHVFDSLLAATAMEEGLTLVTKNRKHFAMIEGLRLGSPAVLRNVKIGPNPPMTIGKLETVDLRELWKHEERGFSAWFESNLDTLSDASKNRHLDKQCAPPGACSRRAMAE
jgi:predicted nucleic acid-binding protein